MAFVESAIFHLRALKRTGEGALAQLPEDGWEWRPDDEANSVALVIQHLRGNMISRWTDFLTTDGEKPTRRRDAEFEPQGHSAAKLRQLWEEGWACCFAAIEALGDRDLERTVKIRGEATSVLDAIHRQLSHYAYHVGQIVQLARFRAGKAWTSLSIPRGKSAEHSIGRYKNVAKREGAPHPPEVRPS